MKRMGYLVCGFLWAAMAVQAADKIGNGGQSLDDHGRPSLRDLVDKSICIWHPGLSFLRQQTRMKAIEATLDQIHPVYSALLEAEASDLTVCLTEGTLRQIPAEDTDGLTIWSNFSGHQVAIRADKVVYIDSKIFSQMDATNQAYLILHELLHGFIDQKVSQRNTKIRSFVSFMHRSEGQKMTQEFFETQVKMDEVWWPTGAELDIYDSLAADFQRALDTRLSAEERYRAGQSIYSAWKIYQNHFSRATRLYKENEPSGSDSFVQSAPREKFWQIIRMVEDYAKNEKQLFQEAFNKDDPQGFRAGLGKSANMTEAESLKYYFLRDLMQEGKDRIFQDRLEASIAQGNLDQYELSNLLDYATQNNRPESFAAVMKAGKSLIQLPPETLYKWLERKEYSQAMVSALLAQVPNARELVHYKVHRDTAIKLAKRELKEASRLMPKCYASSIEVCRKDLNYWTEIVEILNQYGF